MDLGRAVTRRFVDPADPGSLSAHARRRRWARFTQEIGDVSHMRVLDLGGTPEYWRNAPVRPDRVTVVNLARYESPSSSIETVQADACHPPEWLARERFDLVVSNSLLEHVGGHSSRQRLADVVHAAADQHWVQTPYRYFPVEPHWLFPGLQFLPFEARVRVTLHWPLGHLRTSSREVAVASVHEVELIGCTQMRTYFPDSRLWMERLAGLPKSMVAVRTT